MSKAKEAPDEKYRMKRQAINSKIIIVLDKNDLERHLFNFALKAQKELEEPNAHVYNSALDKYARKYSQDIIHYWDDCEKTHGHTTKKINKLLGKLKLPPIT